MHSNKQPSVKHLLINCLVGCAVIVVAGVGLWHYSYNEGEKQSPAAPELGAAFAPAELVMLSKEDKADTFALDIDDLQQSVELFDINRYTSQLGDINEAVNTFASWASFIGTGVGMNLSAEASLKLKALYNTIETVQQKSLPKIRDQYGPLIRAEFANQEAAKSAMTIGKGYKALVFTGSDFKDAAAVEQFHSAHLELFTTMRFEKITYRVRKSDRNPSVKTLVENPDKILIEWTSDDALGAIAVEQLFLTHNHRAANAETAEANAAQ